MRIKNTEFFESTVEACMHCDGRVMDKAEEFKHTSKGCNGETEHHAGWFYWCCSPGCLPEGEAIGPFDTLDDAKADASETDYI